MPGSDPPVLAAAVAPLVAHHVAGDPTPAVVLAAYPRGLYLGLPGHADVLAVLTSDALALPIALRLGRPAAEICWGVEQGAVVTVGRGGVALPALVVRAVRGWSPARVAPGSTLPASPDVDARVLVRGLVGRGPGLTPSGDDTLAGLLLTARALGGWPELAAEAEAALTRTTSLSAALLRAAIDGYAVPAVVTYVAAAVVGDAPACARLRPEVLAFGHSSGAALLEGIGQALALFDAPRSSDRGSQP